MTTITSSVHLPVKEDFFAGVDVGGTKIHIADTLKSGVRRYRTGDYTSIDSVLDAYFNQVGARPKRITLVIAGPRDDETGSIKLTNRPWPAFNPTDAAKQWPGTVFETANDMIGTAAGMLAESSMHEKQLKHGNPVRTGAKVIVSISTGIGVAGAVWDSQTKRYVFVASEGGHINFQARNTHEHGYITHLHQAYPQASAELAIAGKYGVQNLINHFLDTSKAPALHAAITRAQASDRPLGAVLLEFATEGADADQAVAKTILGHMGALAGAYLGDLALTFKATGGVYLSGSVALGLSEYWAEQTDFIERFGKPGGVHAEWLTKIPIYLATDPDVAVAGALALARS